MEVWLFLARPETQALPAMQAQQEILEQAQAMALLVMPERMAIPALLARQELPEMQERQAPMVMLAALVQRGVQVRIAYSVHHWLRCLAVLLATVALVVALVMVALVVAQAMADLAEQEAQEALQEILAVQETMPQTESLAMAELQGTERPVIPEIQVQPVAAAAALAEQAEGLLEPQERLAA